MLLVLAARAARLSLMIVFFLLEITMVSARNGAFDPRQNSASSPSTCASCYATVDEEGI
jgi:hypothetical protein